MATRLEEVLHGQEANYLLPFIWQHGEEEAIIRQEMARIFDSGIRAVCVEARPHPDFIGPRWWHDMDIIMSEARQRGMRVWLLDDDHFPTGHAVGRNANASAALRRLFLKESHVDALGPQQSASFPIAPWLLNPFHPNPNAPQSTLVAAVAARRDTSSSTLTGELIDVTSHVQGDVLCWDIPEGAWRIVLLFISSDGGSERQKDYINVLVPESVRVLIDTVYEAHYERYHNDFGRTFAGFFSDEPGFYNDRQTFDYESAPGKPGVDLPWCDGLLEQLSEALGQDFRPYLPLLWHSAGTLTTPIRFTYMNVVSKLYADSFTRQIGDWCRSHGVQYIGHVLEDNGVHTRLGCGAGHYFRALWGQDMAGLDVVLWQLVPGFDHGPYAGPVDNLDGEFFHYGLAKMGSSLSHIDAKKHGRAMCEVFGAYGWREGLKLMKWITDHMLVRGVNTFVPHAFSQAAFPDPDCPPHLYARGMNPQYRYYGILNRYTNRLSHLLSGGRHVASAAVLYHAEAEWSAAGRPAAWMPFHKPVRELLQHQIDCDVLPADALLESATLLSRRLLVNEESYDCLIVPYSEALPANLLSRLADMAEQGLPVLFVDGLPSRISDRTEDLDSPGTAVVLGRLAKDPSVRSVALDELASLMAQMGFFEVRADGEQPSLHHYHVKHPGFDVFMFFNEHPFHSLETTVHIPASGRALLYNAFDNTVRESSASETHGYLHLPLRLSPYQSVVVLTGQAIQDLPADAVHEAITKQAASTITLGGPWTVSMATSEQYPVFTPALVRPKLLDMSRPDAFPTFSGTYRYETAFECTPEQPFATLDLGEAYEIAEIWVNGQSAGVRICPPYHFEVGALLRPGSNTLAIEVTNTLVKQQRDFLSRFAPQEPAGLLGPVQLMMQ